MKRTFADSTDELFLLNHRNSEIEGHHTGAWSGGEEEISSEGVIVLK
jgi:hypothetical protein